VGFIGAASGPAVLQKFISAVRTQTPPPEQQTKEEQEQRQVTEEQDHEEAVVPLKESGLQAVLSGTSSSDGSKSAKAS